MLGVLAALLLATSCGNSGEDEPEIDWSTYAPQWRQEIEAAIDDGDCNVLRYHWREAQAGSAAHEARFGESNDALMDYISDARSDIGCT